MRSKEQYNHSFHYLSVADAFLENEHGEVLMMRRPLSSKVFPGLYNGVGGKVEHFESPLEAVTREIEEEAPGAAVSNLTLAGIVTIEDEPGQWHVFLFRGRVKKASVQSMKFDEGRLCWVKKSRLHRLELIPDVAAVLDHLWGERLFFAKVQYGNGSMISHGIVEAE